MATVTETLDLPGSGTPSNVTVSIELVGTGGYPVETWVTADGTAVIGKLEPTLTAGAWSVVLVANDSMTPTGTVYRRTITGRGFGHHDYFEVPTGSGSHTLFSLLTDVPGAIEQTALAAEAATRAAADTTLTTAVAAVYPWLIDIDVFHTSISQSNWSSVLAGAYLYGGIKYTVTQNAELNWDVVLGAGTWTVELLGFTNPTYGIVTVALDGTDVGTIDCYTAGAVENVALSLTGVVVAASGKKRMRFKVATKNASSSGYGVALQHVQLRRTV